MKKKLNSCKNSFYRIAKKLFIFLLLGPHWFIAASTYSQATKLSVDVNNETMKELFHSIEKESEYIFFYSQEVDVSKRVAVNMKNATIDKVLDEVLKDTNYSYSISDRQVFIKANPVATGAQTRQQQPQQQLITAQGIVTDMSGEPVIGANVVVKNQTSTGTITDMNGQFSVRVPQSAILQISYIGYITQEVTVQGEQPLKIILREDSQAMEEVVVTALGIKKEKKALAYSVTEVKGDDMNRVKSANLALGLTGKVAGVNVVKPASGVMGSSRTTIRGNGSLNGNNQPLYIVDGVPLDNSGYGQAGMWGGNDGGDGISSINSEDIESMSVLKGGTAAALYGSRAANGAIVITTKKGAAGKMSVEFNSYFTLDNPVVKNKDFQWEYGQGYSGMAPNEFLSAKNTGMLSWGSKLDGSDVEQFDGEFRPYVARKNNFKNFYNNAWMLSNNLAVSGGGQETQFRLGAGDQRANDLYPNSKLERNNITLNLQSKLTDKLTLQTNVMYMRERAQNRPNLGDLTFNGNTYMWIMPTNVDIRTLKKAVNDDGSEYLPTSSGWISNPYFIAYKREQKDSKDRVIGSVQLQYDFTENIYVRGKAGGDMINRRSTDVTPIGTGYLPEGSIGESSNSHGEFNAEAIAGYRNRFADVWGVDAFVGWNTMATWWHTISASGSRFVQPDFHAISNTETTSGSKSFSESYINSLFGQAELSYRSMIYLTLTGRNDWFSALSYAGKTTPNNIFYPSVGVGFIVSEAIEMPDWLPFLKLRGSWAKSGGSVDAYKLGLTYSYDQSFGNNPIGSINTDQIPNLNLKPLTSLSYEVGFDIRFLQNRLGLDFTYYGRNTKDDIVSAGISTASGYENVLINAGEVTNKGIELLLTATPVQTRSFAWNTAFNVSYNKSEVK
ncbi:MAG: SusC/RagA family TonB-linked outer membrane protein [Tannerellaceae bacterium]|nr:SusC/RagA family TonB-linked outer membrane protein [Tannerellaceae bacterium]